MGREHAELENMMVWDAWELLWNLGSSEFSAQTENKEKKEKAIDFLFKLMDSDLAWEYLESILDLVYFSLKTPDYIEPTIKEAYEYFLQGSVM